MKLQFRDPYKVLIEPSLPLIADESGPGWPFADPKNVAVFTTEAVLEQKRPILYITHDAEEGAWQFHDGEDLDGERGRAVSLFSMALLDSTICELAGLPPGWEAERTGPDAPWRKQKQEA
jgi:hypothetical protein